MQYDVTSSRLVTFVIMPRPRCAVVLQLRCLHIARNFFDKNHLCVYAILFSIITFNQFMARYVLFTRHATFYVYFIPNTRLWHSRRVYLSSRGTRTTKQCHTALLRRLSDHRPLRPPTRLRLKHPNVCLSLACDTCRATNNRITVASRL